MQKVQRWSQPFCTWTKARARPAKPSIRCAAVSLTAMMSLTTAFGASPTPKAARASLPRRGAELLGVAEDAIGLGHGDESLRLGLRRAAGDDDLRLRPLAAQRADRLPRLAHRLGGDGAGVDHHRVAQAGALRFAADHFRLGGIEPAAEGDDLDAHRLHAAPASANSAASKRPSCSYSTGPVISTWSSARAPFDREIAARQRDRHLAAGAAKPRGGDGGGASRRTAGPGEAGAALPGADHDMVARRRRRRA